MKKPVLTVALWSSLMLGSIAGASPTSFTYQGRLNDSGAPASGSYEIRFRLYDSLFKGYGMSGYVTNAVVVTDGVFTTEVDFGVGVFGPDPLWLELGVRTNGGSVFTLLSPRQSVTPTPLAIYSYEAGSALSVAESAITSHSLQDAAVISEKIADDQVVRSLNGLHDDLVVVGTNISVATEGNQLVLGGSRDWKLGGNLATGSGDFLGTLDQQPLDLYVNAGRALRLEPTSESPNVIGGYGSNRVLTNVVGATIAGGGAMDLLILRKPPLPPIRIPRNLQVGGDYSAILGGQNNGIWTYAGVIGGGAGNTVSTNGALGVVPGGDSNYVDGTNSLAAGHRARALHNGTFVWADSTEADFASTRSNQFLIRSDAVIIGTNQAATGARLAVNGQVQILGGGPGAGKVLMCDSNGLASWQPPSAMSVFFGQNFSALLPDVINNTCDIEIASVMADRVLLVNGPGLQIERILGFLDGHPHDLPGSNMEFPLVFEYSGSFSNALLSWWAQGQTNPLDRRSMSVIFRDLAGAERARWNLYEMLLTEIGPGTDGRLRYTLRHGLEPDNRFLYERDPDCFPTENSKNPATDGPGVEIEGIVIGRYPAVTVNTNDRLITLESDYIESGCIEKWVKETAAGVALKRSMSIIQEVNGQEVSRRNYFEVFPIWYQQTTGFGQIDKLKEKVILSYDVDEQG